ncbi:type IV secretion system protein VirD4 [Sphingopyxis sp. YR583]|uniref:TrbG/VirB9 family P-type conjugative transfer protein n=1 Tax=Sphingopyxis sp. YR583 TaxID=1881047 RepID=UPI0008A7547C|nr:TrbG/VirB9 family P-type conjugative transfer protein [Sphingopyxis sp. YR583]SEH12567.1 type IV secretion system protein VirD4 [Sphingopyxis sp. YR583]
MTPTKLLIGQILAVFAIMIAGVWAATQWCAAMLGNQPELGSPWFRLFDIPVYEPWALFFWWFRFEAYAPEVFDKAGSLAAASGFLGCAAAVSASLWRARQSRHVTTYGSARWARFGEIDKAGLFGGAGVFIGQYRGRYLRHDGPEHIMAFAPTRSGKGVGLVVPTLLGWTGSAVIHDIKGENWKLTAGWRAKLGHALLFDPTDPASARYNPLLEVRRGTHEVRDAQNIADILVDPVVTTDRRAYHIELESRPGSAMAALSWTYAEDEMVTLRQAKVEADATAPMAAGLAVEALSFGYAISGDRPAWRPLRAFDDGRQTYIEFPPSLAVGEAPPLFVIGDDGEAALVNYRVAGRFYAVDRLFARAELRLGTKKQAIVRIDRLPVSRRRGGRGA